MAVEPIRVESLSLNQKFDREVVRAIQDLINENAAIRSELDALKGRVN